MRAVLEATLVSLLRGPHASGLDEVPILRMIRLSREEIGRRAEEFAARLRAALPASVASEVEIDIRDAESVLGGGSTPAQNLPTRVISVASARHSAAQIEQRLRSGASLHPDPRPLAPVPVVARIEDDRLILDLRTVLHEQEPALLATLASALC